MTLMFLKSLGQPFRRKAYILDLANCFLSMQILLMQEFYIDDAENFTLYYIWYLMSVWPDPRHANLDNLVKVVSKRSLHLKNIFFSL